MTFSRRTLAIVIALVAVFCVDRAIKWWAVSHWAEGVFFIDRTVGVVLERNEGMAYGIRAPQSVLLTATAAIIVGCLYFFIRAYNRRDLPVVTALSLIVLGAFSNGLDRLQHGFVVDYATLTGWPVFNLADAMIAAAAVWLIARILFRRKQPSSHG